MRKIDDNELIQMLKEGRMTQKKWLTISVVQSLPLPRGRGGIGKLGLYNEFEVPETFRNLSDKEQDSFLHELKGRIRRKPH